MSPNVGNFVHDLVEMAKAMETLPQVEHERDRLNSELNQARDIIQSREERIMALKAEVDGLQSKVRTTEAERDDAEIRFLELDEKTHKVLAHVASIQAAALVVQNDLNPPKPEPVPEPKPEPIQAGGIGVAGHPEPIYTSEGFQSSPTAMVGASNEPGANLAQGSGESASPPTAQPSPTPTSANSDPAPTPVAGSTGEGGGDGSRGPYSGKRYYDHPTYVPRQDWIAGGGTEADYDWRPGMTGTSI